ncbi:MAG: hypothetical protein U1E73_10020 [Planctomycetota bacterium]
MAFLRGREFVHGKQSAAAARIHHCTAQVRLPSSDMRNPRIALVVVVVVATLVPLAWLSALDNGARVMPSLGVRMALLSVLFWSMATVALRDRPDARHAGPWIAIGLLSPLLASLVAFPLGVLLLPVELLLFQPGATWATGIAALSASFCLPHLMFPVGLAMGVFAWLVAHPPAEGAQPAGTGR